MDFPNLNFLVFQEVENRGSRRNLFTMIVRGFSYVPYIRNKHLRQHFQEEQRFKVNDELSQKALLQAQGIKKLFKEVFSSTPAPTPVY
jgi:hypothetical protein